ncbi:MAG: hypothetical protein MUC47_01690 [Candidatus Kapabacteria bacterium]|jgi:hypothetical protein|nr:hypothetical protein [Candidatus Kapabacteria bacterium]
MNVLVIGEHPQMLGHVIASLRHAGHDARGLVGSRAALTELRLSGLPSSTDVVVIGGPVPPDLFNALVHEVRRSSPRTLIHRAVRGPQAVVEDLLIIDSARRN